MRLSNALSHLEITSRLALGFSALSSGNRLRPEHPIRRCVTFFTSRPPRLMPGSRLLRLPPVRLQQKDERGDQGTDGLVCRSRLQQR
jgi:hypothetical protein